MWRDARLQQRAASLRKGLEGIATLFALAEQVEPTEQIR
jgi:hypothetical protein